MATKKHKVKRKVLHNGKLIKAGEEVSLTDEQVKTLPPGTIDIEAGETKA